jgi:CMP-2-keto-3-deoxyoctulosonic acid synthetase
VKEDIPRVAISYTLQEDEIEACWNLRGTLPQIWQNVTKNYLSAHTQKSQFVLTSKVRMVTKEKILNRNKTDLVKYRHLNLVNHSSCDILDFPAIHCDG